MTVTYWWLPLVWIARHALREAEEQCCDAWVVWTFPDAARTYAEALLEAVDFLSGVESAVPLAASGLGRVDHLKRRMTMIMQGTTPRALNWGGLIAVLGLSATMLPLSPTWAQQRPSSMEEAFYRSLVNAHEFNDPSWPFLIKVKDVQGKTLIDATFKHRAARPNAFDMIVQARKAAVEFDTEKGVARVHLDGVEITDPRQDVTLTDGSILEITIPAAADVRADDDEEGTPAFAPDKPVARDPRPRPAAEAQETEIGVIRRVDPKGLDLARIQVLERALLALKDARRIAEKDTPGSRERVRKAMDQLQAELNAMGVGKPVEVHIGSDYDVLRPGDETKVPAYNAPRPGDEMKVPGERTAARPRKPGEATPDPAPTPKAKGPVAGKWHMDDQQPTELERLREEVAARRAALMEAEMRLAKAVKQAAEAQRTPEGKVGAGDRLYEFRYSRSGQGPVEYRVVKPFPRPEDENRIGELEEKLEKLQDEVKSLKKDSPSRH